MFLWSFGSLSWFSTYVFISNSGLNGYAYIFEIVLDILGKLNHDSWNICGCLTLNEMHIELASLIICLISNLSNTFTWSKRTVLYIVDLIILCTSTETCINWKFKDKIFNLFKAPNKQNCCANVLWKLLPVLIMFLGKWSI